MLPQAKKLSARDLGEETIVYDAEVNKFHRLNRTAALIWRHCDGQTSVAQVAAQLRKMDLPADEDVVWLALDRLDKAHLLRGPWVRPAEGVSRRAVMRKLGRTGALSLLLPVVASMTAPTPAMAASGQVAAGVACRAAGGLCFIPPCPVDFPTNIGLKDCKTPDTPEQTCCA
jgi:hypothetical protein